MNDNIIVNDDRGREFVSGLRSAADNMRASVSKFNEFCEGKYWRSVDGMDIIQIILDEEQSAFPLMKFDTMVKIDCQKDYGEFYCKNMLGLTPEIIVVRH